MKHKPGSVKHKRKTECRFRGVIREASRGDIPTLAAIHCESLGDDFLVRLGPSFLRRVFFPTLFDSPRSTVYLAEEGGRQVGLLVGRVGLGGVLGEALRYHSVWFFVTVAGAYVRRPWMLLETVGIVAQLWWRRLQPTDNEGDMFLIAVSGLSRRRGVASSLIRHVISAFREVGIQSYRIMAHAENIGSAATFKNVGFRERTLSRFAGRLWRELALDQRIAAKV